MKNRDKKSVKFLHISDLHKLNDYKDKGGIYNNIISNMSDPFIQLQSILNQIGNDFDFVIVSGDVCEEGEVDDYLTVKRKLEQLFSCPIFICSGNHDNKENLMKAFEKKYIETEVFEDIRLDNIRVILFDSSHHKYNDGYISEKTCDLLQQALNEKSDCYTILVTHHHLLDEQFEMPKTIYPERLRDIIGLSDADLILTGHTHHIYHGSFMQKPYHTTGSLSFVAKKENNNLVFYEQPSAIVFSLDENKLSYKDIYTNNDIKFLETWNLNR